MKQSAFKISALLVILIALLPILYFPISIDHAIYTRGGRAILDEATLYKDFIDTKPPLIYYIFALKILLFGDSEISVRIFDLFWQGITITLLIYALLKRTGNEIFAWCSGIIYSLLYATLGFSQSLQCETLPGWAFIGLLYIHSGINQKRSWLILSGVCIGWAMAFKYTFGILLPVIFLYDLLQGKSFRNLLWDYSWITAAAFLTLGITLLSLLNHDVRQGYGLLLQYQAIYASFPPLDLNMVRYILKATAGFYSDRYSLFFVILTVIGCREIFKKNGKNWNTPYSQLLILSCFIAAGLLLSAFIERKVNPYHFSRTYIPLSVLAGSGLTVFLRGIKNYYSNFSQNNIIRTSHYAIAAVGCMIILLFSPFPRWINLIKTPVLYYKNITKYDKLFDNPDDNAVARTQHKAVARYLLQTKQAGEKTFIMSVGAGTIDYFMQNRPVLKFGSTLQLHFNYWGVDNLHQQARRDLELTTWLVVQANDHQPFFNGHSRSNWESLQQDSLLYPIVKNSFIPVDTIGYFYIFKRK